jgi:hydrogenase expression/formation protein HypE
VQNGCHLLGLDPLYIANEGKMIAVVAEQAAEKALATMRQDPLGREAEIIGEVAAATESRVSIKTLLGAWRIVPWPSGELLPRIC